MCKDGPPATTNEPALRSEWPELRWVLPYVLALLAYLGFSREGELGHWLSLVLVPGAGVWYLTRRSESQLRLRTLAFRLGLHWPRENRGLGLALVFALLVQVLQLMNRSRRYELLDTLSSGDALLLVPAAFLLVLVTAAFTEEFFFRGIVQRSLAARFESDLIAILITSLIFAAYHLPYAYFEPGWPSAGNLAHSIRLASANGLLGGVVLGAVFARARGSLVPCVLVHAAVDWIPAVRLLASWQQ